MVGYGISRLLGGSNGGGPPDIDRDSDGAHAGTQSFFSLSDAWLRLSMLENWRGCTGDSGSPNLLGATDLVIAISIGGDFAYEAMNAALRLDTPSARAFLGPFVELP